MTVPVNSPLRLTPAFKDRHQADADFTRCFEAIRHIKLFTLEIELDKYSIPVFSKLKDTLPFSAFQKILRVSSADKVRDPGFGIRDFFNELEIEIPFSLDDKALNEELKNIEGFRDAENLVLSFYLTRQNIKQFERILKFAASSGIKKIKIPSPDLVNHAAEIKNIYLRAEDLKGLDALKSAAQGVSLQVHDYFLAKHFGLKDAEQFNGCQGGRLLGYILNGIVYPCKSIPLPLGSLFEENFDTIWGKAKGVMDKYTKTGYCGRCAGAEKCKYGCPGTAFFLNEGLKDPLCDE